MEMENYLVNMGITAAQRAFYSYMAKPQGNHSGKPSTTSKAGGMKSPLPGLMLAPPLGGVSLALLPLVLERPSLSFFNH